jgi:hypothetical protein
MSTTGYSLPEPRVLTKKPAVIAGFFLFVEPEQRKSRWQSTSGCSGNDMIRSQNIPAPGTKSYDAFPSGKSCNPGSPYGTQLTLQAGYSAARGPLRMPKPPEQPPYPLPRRVTGFTASDAASQIFEDRTGQKSRRHWTICSTTWIFTSRRKNFGDPAENGQGRAERGSEGRI